MGIILKTTIDKGQYNLRPDERLSSRLKNQLVVFTFLSSLAFPAVSQVNNPAL
jgi:hypothetical protein